MVVLTDEDTEDDIKSRNGRNRIDRPLRRASAEAVKPINDWHTDDEDVFEDEMLEKISKSIRSRGKQEARKGIRMVLDRVESLYSTFQ